MKKKDDHSILFYRAIKAQVRLAMAANRKEFAADINPVEYSKAVRQFHVAKRAARRASEALAEVSK